MTNGRDGRLLGVGIRRLAIVCCLASGGCYTGLSGDVEPTLDSGGDGGDPSSGDGTSSDDNDTGPEPEPEAAELDPTRVWRLSAAQYERTVAEALGIDVTLRRIAWGSRTEDFINYAYASGVDDVFFGSLEEDLFNLATENLDTIGTQLPCSVDALDEACLSSFLGPFLIKAHRSDTTPSAPYLELYANLAPTQGPRDAFASVLVAVLLSPKAFFRTQLGGEGDEVTMAPYELAEYLAYMVWNGPPDDQLLAAAADGSLADRDVFAAELDRMLEGPEGNRGMVEFLSQWLGLTGVLGMEKNPTAFPEFDADMRASMMASTLDLFEWVLDEKDADFRTLLTTNASFVDDRLAGLYGVEAPVDGMPVELSPDERRGIFTHPAVVVAMSDAAGTAVIYRGKALMGRMLCLDLPPRPAGVEPTPPAGIPDDATTRQKLESIEDMVPCNSCHISMHPFSFAMEQYDGVGRFRTLENEQTIDPAGQLLLPGSPEPVGFGDVRELIDTLADRPEIYDCLVKQGVRYTQGRREDGIDDDDIARMSETFREAPDIRALFRELVLTAAFRTRAKENDDACITP
ncbi:MAG: DUF1592 domain-containing protein [Nannocystaceae bacterium]|nr:DUF1592 domain-containing protein [Nannocystaceae bacterium]